MTKTFTAHNIHQEKVLQEHLISLLVNGQGYERRDAKTDYDQTLAMDRDLVLRFVKTTQSQPWEKMEQHYADSTEKTFFTQLEKALKDRGLLDVLRKGIKIVPGIELSLCYFRPASGLEPKRVKEYEANVLSVMDEVVYSKKHGKRLDVVLLINGLPVVTIEAKNLPTGTTFRNAEKQYREDRSPLGEPLLTFKRGALVHFALDEDNVSMTTRLQNSKTRFLPFNRGRNGGAGNDDIKGEHRIAYLYMSGEWGKAIFSRAVLLDIVGQFMHLENNGRKEALIFPRFQQTDAVRKAMAHAKTHGPGNNYLIQHSAGSGKSNTIGWLAHHAINLHDNKDRQVFNAAIIVTDRVVLDRQLQNTVAQFEQTAGIVKKIDGTSRQLKEAITGGARIIVTTIQKFSTDHLSALSGQSGRAFALIVDEAHSGQTGKTAQAMASALTREAETSDDIEDMIAKAQKARGPQPNISYFAFTATPRHVTLERFGVRDADGIPRAFHLYPMRQAIEERFILDVLQNYVTYKAYYQLEKAIEDDPELSGRKGQRRVARYASLHCTAIGQKVEIIVEHFRRHVMHELDGQAKAMVVTQGREHALKYFSAVNEYIKSNGYNNLKVLVAFSEFTLNGERMSEFDLNGFSETELPYRFDGFKPDGTPYKDTYHILIVAEKYQTGFDQSKLCAMYVDRQLAGLQTVQTLSRLNRTQEGKDRTFILDFQNTIEDIQDAFRPYFEATTLEALSDPNQIYDLEGKLFKFGYLDKDEIDKFSQLYFRGKLNRADRPVLAELVREAVTRFEAEENEGRQDEFRQLLKSYNRFYAFISQVTSLDDTSLEKLSAYGDWLARLIPDREIPPEIDITDEMVRLHAFKVESKEEGSASLSEGDTDVLGPVKGFGANPYTDDEKKTLSEIVKLFNDHHGTDFSESDIIRFEHINSEILNEDLIAMIRKNSPDVVYPLFKEAFFEGILKTLKRDEDMHNIILSDTDGREMFIRHFFGRALREVQETI